MSVPLGLSSTWWWAPAIRGTPIPGPPAPLPPGVAADRVVGGGYRGAAAPCPARLYPPADGSWPSVKAGVPSPVRIKYKAGFKVTDPPSTAVLPLAVSQAMLLLIGQWYENREGGSPDDYTVLASTAGSVRPQVTFAR